MVGSFLFGLVLGFLCLLSPLVAPCSSLVTNYQNQRRSPREGNEALTMMRTCLLQDCSQQPVPDGFTQPLSECLRDKMAPFAMARQLLSGKAFA